MMVDKVKVDILIVEDSPTQAEELRYILEKSGYRIVVAQDGRKALAGMRQRRPTLVISDIIMPGMDGFQLCRQIKDDEDLKDVPLILLTALSDPEDVLRGLECGADNFITKPYESDHLLARIQHILLNMELRRESDGRKGVEIFFKGRKYVITADSRQILDLLLSTYETAVRKNQKLKKAREELETLNEDLEKKVAERTAALIAEIEERKKAEEEIKRLNNDLERRVAERTEQLKEANKDLESFSYSVSHDLRVPLRHISGFMELLQERVDGRLDEKGLSYMSTISRAARKMGALIDDLLSFSRMGRAALHTREVSLASLVKEAIGEMEEEVKGREIVWRIEDLPDVHGDPALLKLVIVNLVSNAVKFTRASERAEIEIGYKVEKEESVFFMRDNGVGFDREYAGKLFGVFQRLHSEHDFEGTGIGLANVRRIISRHGGRTWAEGSEGKGATFYFSLPRTKEA